ncbi:MAG: hypothetical protein AAF800_07785 [Planctomycetota bacterium]
MDIDYLLEKINQDRAMNVRLSTNSGKVIDLPPGCRAFIDATDTIHIMWPPLDPADPFRVSKSIMLSAVNVATLEPAIDGAA